MRFSANLNIIIKAIEKVSSFAGRDFIELENLQSNPLSANKFTLSCYNKIKNNLIDDLTKIRPDFNIIFADGQKIIRREDAEYSFIIFPIDGLENLTRSNPDFTIAIALEHLGKDGKKEPISVAINKIAGKELFYCEKGFGAYLNSRRIRVSKRSASEPILITSSNPENLPKNTKNFFWRHTGCSTLDIAYLASAKIEKAIFASSPLFNPFLLLAREAGGKVVEENNLIIASNGLV